jgi:anti-sigma B factor antagonist
MLRDGWFGITQNHFRRASLLEVRGELDVAHAPTLGIAVQQALGTNPIRLVIDLCQVTFVDARGLAALLSAHRCAQKTGARLILACDVQSTLRLLELTRLRREFDVRPTGAAALSPLSPTRG